MKLVKTNYLYQNALKYNDIVKKKEGKDNTINFKSSIFTNCAVAVLSTLTCYTFLYLCDAGA